jgi:hypothetical protein
MDPEDLISDSGALSRVCGDQSPAGNYRILELVFERGTLTLSCDADSDELLLTASHGDASTDDLSADPALAPLIGKVIESAWWLTNQNGYRDGFQVRLLDLSDRSEATRQFEVAAAALHIRTVVG